MNAETLSGSRLFAGVTWDSVAEELGGCQIRSLEDAEVLSGGSDAQEHLWIVLSGCLRVRMATNDDPVLAATAGEAVGAWDAIDPDRRARWVIAEGATTVVEIPLAAYKRLLQRHPTVCNNLWREAVHRIRSLEGEVAFVRNELDAYRRQATRDALTGLFNRRWLDEQLSRLMSPDTSGRQLSVVMVDVDYFKRLNDTLGHAIGDVVLVAIAQTLRRRFRPADIVARFGGEEFVVVMPATQLAAASNAAERVRRAVEFTRFAGPDGAVLPQVTVSCGVAEMIPGDDPGSLVRRADQALYAAKSAGRNRVVAG
ncbi:MAG: GGDEF domain-containing protein [Alphaproteobacteria bacterium]|nr:GGDEF domain-containing protein [Alphaproteobacteria bacterium]MCB9697375.1 GGDEF domain-containing protein [Alphaproteobacteria bacterium]